MTDILNKILGIVGPKGLITGEDVKNRPGDWLGRSKCEALAIVRPGSTQEVSDVLKHCHSAGQKIVAAGGLTGMVHGTYADANTLLLSTERMNEIEKIDPVGRTLTVQSGAPMQKVQEQAQANNLLFALDLGARGSATIGGNIATNAGGNQVLRYGMMRDQVLGLEVVLADGTVISSMNELLKNNAGYDLKQMFIGSEGTLGIVTRAVLRLHPATRSQSTAIVAVDRFSNLVEFFKYIGTGLGGSLTAFEVMWEDHYDLMAVQTGRHTPPIAPGAAFYIIVEANGISPEKDEEHFIQVMGEALETGLLKDAVIATSEKQREAIWYIREDIVGLSQAIMPATIFDISLPISEMETYTAGLKQSVREKWGDEAKVTIFGHLGDGNLHIAISPRPWNENSQEMAEELVYTPLAEIGGSISAEHGIGLEKRSWLHISRTPGELDLMRTIKTALDPKNILNPGKILAL